MKRISNIVFLLACSLFLVLAASVTLLRRGSSLEFYENRKYAEKPTFSFAPVSDGGYFSDYEKYLSDHAAGRSSLVKLKTWADLNIFRRPVVNDVVAGGEILLPWNDYETVDANAIAYAAEYTAQIQLELQKQVELYGGKYLMAAIPCQYAYYEGEYPWYLNSRTEYTAESTDALFDAMESAGVNYSDLGPLLIPMNKDKLISSSVDNHSSLLGAYETYRAVVNELNSQPGVQLRFPDESQITFTPVENRFLGSRCRKLLDLVKSDELFYTSSYTPAIEYTREDNGVPDEIPVYVLPGNPYECVMYSMYMGGDIGETVIKTNRPDLPDVLIYGDSFTNALESMFYYSCDEMRSIDLRHYKEMTLSAYIDKYQPDIVIFIRDYEQIIKTDGNAAVFG